MPRYSDMFGGVLVGGRARRLGGLDKARLPVDGSTSLWHLVDRLRSRVDTVVLAGRAGQAYPEVSVPLLVDRCPDAGPLAGVEALLAAAPAPWCMVVACDLVRFDPQLVDLLALARRPDLEVVILRSSRGLEPTCALYHQSFLARATTALAGGERALYRLIATAPHQVVVVPAALGAALDNVNSPAELGE